jgi:alpha-tubulin suppressor-like RCC1 family protein
VEVTIPGLDATALIAAGLDHSMAYDPLTDTLWVWGYNTYGQLGDGSTTNSIVPKAIPLFSLNVGGGTLPQIFAVGHHSHARKTSGQWFSWGSNSSGQLGNGTIVDSRIPVPVSGF